jgi:pyruvate dehydrogenase complex dehydrogenase (E1) component
MHEYLRSPGNVPARPETHRRAETLLELLDHLPAALSRCRSLVALLASGTYVSRVPNAMRNLAREADLDSSTSHARLRAQVDDSVADLLTRKAFSQI